MSIGYQTKPMSFVTSLMSHQFEIHFQEERCLDRYQQLAKKIFCV